MSNAFLKKLIKDIIKEAPISSFNRIGQWDKNSSYKEVDRKLLTSEKAVEKIKNKWRNTEYNFDLYFVNDKRVNKPEFREVGEVSEQFVREEMKITTDEIPSFNPNNITVIFTGNYATQKVPLTAWVMAHRLSHALQRSNYNLFMEINYNLINDIEQLLSLYNEYSPKKIAKKFIYDRYQSDSFRKDSQKYIKNAFYQLGTMKSARDKKLRDVFEFIHELFAQWLIEGSVRFNKIDDRGYIGNIKIIKYEERLYEIDIINEHMIEGLEHKINSYFNSIMKRYVGKILVM